MGTVDMPSDPENGAASSDGKRQKSMGNGRRRILVLGPRSALMEGVSDLLQLVGYQVDQSSSWDETERTLRVTPPNLLIVDLSDSNSEVYRLSDRIRNTPAWSEVPLLFISFSGDDRIRELQRHTDHTRNGMVRYYAHTVLGVDGLLEEVQASLA
jgi:CheY-like chemotaxis protein